MDHTGKELARCHHSISREISDAISLLSTGAVYEAGQLFDIVLFNVWIDLVQSFDSKSARVRHALELACVDLSKCAGDFRGLLLQALLAYKQGNLAYEQFLRKHLLDTDREMFYETLLGFS